MKFAIIFSRLLLLLLACGATGGTRASAAESKDFRDWYAACDNLRNCSAYGFQADDPAYAYIRIERGGAPTASARITIVADVNEKTTASLAFDDAALHGLPSGPVTLQRGDQDSYGRQVIDDAAAVETLVASMRKAQTLLVRRIDPPGGEKSDPETSEISMSGAVAALLWIDEQQQRLDTVTALIRRGDKLASSIALQPKAPIVHAAKPLPADAAPKPLPSKAARALAAKAKELCGGDERTTPDDAVPLGRDSSLYGFSCLDNSGAYNRLSVFLIVPDANPQAARAANFVYPSKIGTNDAPELINAGFDRSIMTLSTFSKGRGIGDCGSAEDWVWDGQTFRLVLLRAMPHCKGITDNDWPVLYRAERR